MFKRWIDLTRQPDLMLLMWLALQSAVGWWLAPSLRSHPFLWAGTLLTIISFAMMLLAPSVWQRIEPFRRYPFLLCFVLYTYLIAQLSPWPLMSVLYAVGVMVFATLYLEPFLIWLVAFCSAPGLFASFQPITQHAAWITSLIVLMVVVSLHTVCRVSREKMLVIRKLERDQNFERLGQQQHLATIGQIAASIAHDIRNPLTSISGFVQLIEKSERRENYLEYYNIIRSEIGRIDSLLREVLLLSKSHTIDREAWQPVELGSLLKRLATLLGPDAIKSNIQIQLKMEVDPVVVASEEKLHQVFLNVLRNAFEAVHEKGTIEIYVETEEKEAIVRICDSGSGIPPNKLNHLFTPFFTTKAEGTGLGLSICQSIIKAYGGTIEARNREDRGAEFIITLPT